MSDLLLSNDHATATVSTDGGRLASLVVDGLELLITDGDRPSRWGMFPMIPWCGRLPFGRLHFQGIEYSMPINSAPHANHGRAFLQEWTVENAAPDRLTIETALVEPWPFGGRAVQHFELSDSALVVTAEVHAGEVAMPAMAGWHPWFRRRLARNGNEVGGDAELQFTADAVYSVDDDLVPTGALEAVPPAPWNACFVGVSDGPRITWPAALSLHISSTFDRWVIFTEPDHALCVEPQSGPPAEFDLDPHVLQPGEVLAGSMTMRWA